MTTFYSDLTNDEKIEFSKLKKQLFGDAKFKIFSKEEEESVEYKRYDHLLQKKTKYLKSIHKQ